jgi:hypothetical protein
MDLDEMSEMSIGLISTVLVLAASSRLNHDRDAGMSLRLGTSITMMLVHAHLGQSRLVTTTITTTGTTRRSLTGECAILFAAA